MDKPSLIEAITEIYRELKKRAAMYEPTHWVIPMSRKSYKQYMWVVNGPDGQVRYRLRRGHCIKHKRINHHGVLSRLRKRRA